jgi:hypothetical protein
MNQPTTRSHVDYMAKAKWEAEIALHYYNRGELEKARAAMSRCQNAAFEANRRLKKFIAEKEPA